MTLPAGFVDVHCHMLPGIDDGADSWEQSLEMARMASGDGTRMVIVTPHQLGNFAHNHGDMIRERTTQFQDALNQHEIPLNVLPGADVRIEPDMIRGLHSGEVLSLADRKKHVLLELPHELYFPLEGIISDLAANGMVGILSHPERNQGILKNPDVLLPLVERGCVMQITAGSLLGSMGPACEQFCHWMIERDIVHIMATDAHGTKSRRPLMRRAFDRLAELSSKDVAVQACCTNPSVVADGGSIELRPPRTPTSSLFGGWFRRRKAA